MSWSFYVARLGVGAAKQQLQEKEGIPQGIKDYISTGIDGLVMHHGDHVLVDINAHGHICDGPKSHSVTSCSIDVHGSPNPSA